MSFSRPEFFWLLLLLPLCGAWVIRGHRIRQRSWRTLAQRGRPPGLRTVEALIVAVLLVTAAARPRFGPSIAPPLPPGHDVILMIDVSRSMAAEDAVPNRLGVAIESAVSLIDALAVEPSNRVGVVAFAGRGVPRYPLTENLGAVVEILKKLRPGSVEPGGTDLGAGLDAAIEAFGEQEHADGRAIVIFSDGEDLANRWKSRLDRLDHAGIVVHVVAIGDAEQGHAIPTSQADRWLTYQGRQVLSRRDDTVLEAVAQETGGATLKLGLASTDLGTLYQTRIAPVAQRKREATRFADRPERFPLFLATAMGFALAGCWPVGRSGPWRWLMSRIAASILVCPLILGALGANQAPAPGQARSSSEDKPVEPRATTTLSPARLVARGREAFIAGRLPEALDDFRKAADLAPREAIPAYNTAAVLFQLGRYEDAQTYYHRAAEHAAPLLRMKIDFALGNTALALGDVAGAILYYDDCLAAPAKGPAPDAVRQDAAINRLFAIERQPPPAGPQQEPKNPRDANSEQGNDQTAEQETDEPDQQPGANGDPSNPDGRNPEANESQRPPQKRRRSGGASGDGKSSSASGGDTPDDRLDQILQEIRNAQGRRLPDEPPPSPTDSNNKDW